VQSIPNRNLFNIQVPKATSPLAGKSTPSETATTHTASLSAESQSPQRARKLHFEEPTSNDPPNSDLALPESSLFAARKHTAYGTPLPAFTVPEGVKHSVFSMQRGSSIQDAESESNRGSFDSQTDAKSPRSSQQSVAKLDTKSSTLLAQTSSVVNTESPPVVASKAKLFGPTTLRSSESHANDHSHSTAAPAPMNPWKALSSASPPRVIQKVNSPPESTKAASPAKTISPITARFATPVTAVKPVTITPSSHVNTNQAVTNTASASSTATSTAIPGHTAAELAAMPAWKRELLERRAKASNNQ
jgi:hypothetical protein